MAVHSVFGVAWKVPGASTVSCARAARARRTSAFSHRSLKGRSSWGHRGSEKTHRFVSLIGKSLVNLSEEGAMAAFEPGAKAPDFTLAAAMPDGSERQVSLSGLAGGWVVVFVYPKDSTSG